MGVRGILAVVRQWSRGGSEERASGNGDFGGKIGGKR